MIGVEAEAEMASDPGKMIQTKGDEHQGFLSDTWWFCPDFCERVSFDGTRIPKKTCLVKHAVDL